MLKRSSGVGSPRASPSSTTGVPSRKKPSKFSASPQLGAAKVSQLPAIAALSLDKTPSSPPTPRVHEAPVLNMGMISLNQFKKTFSAASTQDRACRALHFEKAVVEILVEYHKEGKNWDFSVRDQFEQVLLLADKRYRELEGKPLFGGCCFDPEGEVVFRTPPQCSLGNPAQLLAQYDQDIAAARENEDEVDLEVLKLKASPMVLEPSPEERTWLESKAGASSRNNALRAAISIRHEVDGEDQDIIRYVEDHPEWREFFAHVEGDYRIFCGRALFPDREAEEAGPNSTSEEYLALFPLLFDLYANDPILESQLINLVQVMNLENDVNEEEEHPLEREVAEWAQKLGKTLFQSRGVYFLEQANATLPEQAYADVMKMIQGFQLFAEVWKKEGLTHRQDYILRMQLREAIDATRAIDTRYRVTREKIEGDVHPLKSLRECAEVLELTLNHNEDGYDLI